MKRCSHCQSTYADFVEFCFEDGEVLMADTAPADARRYASLEALDPTEPPPLPPRPVARPPVPPVRRDFVAVGGVGKIDEFEAPEPGSAEVRVAAPAASEDYTTEIEPEAIPAAPLAIETPAEQSFWEGEAQDEPAGEHGEPRGSTVRWLAVAVTAAVAVGVGGGAWFLLSGDGEAPPGETVVADTKAVERVEVPGAQSPQIDVQPPGEVEVVEVEEGVADAEDLPELTGLDEEAEEAPQPVLSEPDPAEPAAQEEPAVAAPVPAPVARPRPRPRPRPEPDLPRLGAVSITSSPAGAAVLIGGDLKGETPLTVDLAYGSHPLEIRLSGHTAHQGTVQVGGERVEVPMVTLTSALFGAPSGAPSVAQPAEEAGEVEKVMVQVMVVWVGHDGHTLRVDGVDRGMLPVAVSVEAGAHTFEVVAPDGATQSERREVSAGQGGVLTFGI